MSGAVYRLAWRRLAAWAVDWLIVSAYAASLVPLGLLLVDRSVRLPSLVWNAAAFVVLIVPATVWLAAWESSRSAATPGKRLLGLRVRVLREGDVGRRRGTYSRSRFRGNWATQPRSCSPTQERAGQRC